jgi:hypothetical protein
MPSPLAEAILGGDGPAVVRTDVHFRRATTLRLAGQNPMQVFVPFCISYSRLKIKSRGIANILTLGGPGFEPCLTIIATQFHKSSNSFKS